MLTHFQHPITKINGTTTLSINERWYKQHTETVRRDSGENKKLSIYKETIQKLAVEMYKVKNDLAPIPVQNLFTKVIPREGARRPTDWILPRVRTENYGKETVRYRGPIIWSLIPDNIKESKSLVSFKDSISNWKPIGCTCRLCKIKVPNFGYVRKNAASDVDGTLTIC